MCVFLASPLIRGSFIYLFCSFGFLAFPHSISGAATATAAAFINLVLVANCMPNLEMPVSS